MLGALREAIKDAKTSMGIVKEGATLEERVDFSEGFERKKCAALLFFGAIFGLLGFCFAFIIGLLTFAHPFLSNFHVRQFPSGMGYFPATVSEMVHDPSQPAGKCFFAFEFIGAYFIFASWYPWQLRNVYIGDDATVGFNVSWMMFRQFVPPAGMMLVATVTTTPFAQATLLDYFCIGIHLFGAVTLFAGYGLVEAISLGWGPLPQPPVAERTIKGMERTVRIWLLNGIIFWYVLFCVLQGVLLAPLERFGCQNDVWQPVEVRDQYNHTLTEITLVDTASGLILFLKILSYMSEVMCGLFLIASFFTIWFCCHERHADLKEELDKIR